MERTTAYKLLAALRALAEAIKCSELKYVDRSGHLARFEELESEIRTELYYQDHPNA